MCACMHVYGDHRTPLGVSLYFLCCFEAGSLVCFGILHTSWPDSFRILLSLPPCCHWSARNTDLWYCFWLHMGSGKPDFGSHAPGASVLHTQLSFSHPLFICLVSILYYCHLLNLSSALCVSWVNSFLLEVTNFQLTIWSHASSFPWDPNSFSTTYWHLHPHVLLTFQLCGPTWLNTSYAIPISLRFTSSLEILKFLLFSLLCLT